MKNRQTNHHLAVNTSDIYCLHENKTNVLIAGSVLTSVFSPPPPTNVTVKYNNTLRQNSFGNFGSSTAAAPARPFWTLRVFVVTFGIERFCMIRDSPI